MQPLKDMWNKFSRAGKIILTIIIIALIGVGIWLIVKAVKNDDETTSENNTPEVAQVFEPSIGSPLPADVPAENADKGAVDGAVTETPSTTETPAVSTPMEPTTPATPEASKPDYGALAAYVAPTTGVNDKLPFTYQNPDTQISLTLPAHTDVQENGNDVTFTLTNGSKIIISQSKQIDTLANIQSQLGNSTSVSNVKSVTMFGVPAISFYAKGIGQSYAFNRSDKTYYVFGWQASVLGQQLF